MARLEDGAVRGGGHQRPVVHAQVITEADDVDEVADRREHMVKRVEVDLEQRIQQPLHVGAVQHQVHEEVVDAAQEGAPFEQVAAHHHHQRSVGRGAQGEGLATQRLPEAVIAGMVPGAVDEAGPQHGRHDRGQAGEVVGVAVEVGEVCLVEEGRAQRHGRDAQAILREGLPGTVRLHHRVEPRRDLHVYARWQRHRLPVRVGCVEPSPDVDGVDPQPVEQLLGWLRQLLDHVVHLRALVSQAKPFHQVGVRHGRDARAGGGAQVDRQMVWLPVRDAGQHALARRHDPTPRAGRADTCRTRAPA